ncbi:MAG: FAD:protein FMN transferase [Candidatus Nanopelagicales bacterium]
MYVEERQGRAMGSDAQVIVYARTAEAARTCADLALVRVALLEQCWSRFRSDSELNGLNSRAGTGPVAVSDDLATLVQAMLEASEWTQGAFDPTVLGVMNELGYDRDFAAVIAHESLASAREALSPTRGTAGIVVEAHTVTLPSGIGIDPGAIGKGLAADIVASEIHEAGADGILVNLGGDVSTRGTADGQPWIVGIRDDRWADSRCVHEVSLAGDRRAVATSSSLRRRWNGRHHVIDPLTGLPSASDVAQVTVIAPTGWQAEAATTLALVRGASAAEQWLSSQGLDALLFSHDQDAPPHRVTSPQRIPEFQNA